MSDASGQDDCETERSPTTWRVDHLERNQFEVPRLRVPRQSRSDSVDVAGSFQTTRFLDERLRWKRVYSRDVPYRNMFMGMVNEVAVTDTTHRSDEPNLWIADIIRDCAGR